MQVWNIIKSLLSEIFLIISLRQLQTGSLKNSVWGKCKLSACGLSLAAVRETASITVSWAGWSR